MTLRVKSVIRYLLAYGIIELGFLIWRLSQQMVDHKVAIFIWGIALIIFFGGAEYYLLFFNQSRPKCRELWGNLSLVGISTLIMFVVFCYVYALILNRRGYYDRHQLFFAYFRPHPELGYIGQSNLENFELSWDLGKIKAVPHPTDQYGFRADDSGHEVPVAVVGDSFGFGAWMSTPESWPEKLEDQLGVPVTNYSASGYSLWQYNRLIDLYATRFQNEAVIYSIFANDLKNDLEEEDHKNDYYQYVGYEKFKNPIFYTIKDLGLTIDAPISQAYRIFEKKVSDLTRLESTKVDNGLVLFKDYTGIDSDYFSDGSEAVVFDRLTEAIKISEDHGIQLVAVLFPSKESVYHDKFVQAFGDEALEYLQNEETAYAGVCSFLRERAVPCYDLTDDLRQQAASMPVLYFEIDSHLNQTGNALSAKLIADYLLRDEKTAEFVTENR